MRMMPLLNLDSARRPPRRWQLAVAGTAVLLLSLVGLGGVAASQQSEGVDLQGKRVDPLKAAAGKPVVLIFVRTDCPISNRYAPTVQSIQAEFAGHAVFWLVYPDADESPEKIRKHEQEYAFSLPALRDPGHQLVRMSHVEITPEVAVFGFRGELAYHGRIDNLYESIGRARSAPTTHELKDALQDVLAGQTPRVSKAPAVGCSIMDMRMDMRTDMQ
jgi:thiol-disulfide isomerase/thioredoxin